MPVDREREVLNGKSVQYNLERRGREPWDLGVLKPW
jgi:hypothetical protein